MDVKPWEPVTCQYIWHDGFSGVHFTWDERDEGALCNELTKAHGYDMNVTLANNQRIIVRALSEDRKAARAARKEAS